MCQQPLDPRFRGDDEHRKYVNAVAPSGERRYWKRKDVCPRSGLAAFPAAPLGREFRFPATLPEDGRESDSK